MRIFSIILTFFAVMHPAYAHVGHVGELAGHAHWVGVAAGIAAAAIAVAIAKGKKSVETENEQEEVSEEASNDEVGEPS